jgi:hypothetical protein
MGRKARALNPNAANDAIAGLKRPKSSFFEFGDAVRPQLKVEHPGTSMAEISKFISLKWKALTESERQVYVDKANAAKEAYNEEKKKLGISSDVKKKTSDLPAGWRRFFDVSSGKNYWLHSASKTISWTLPTADTVTAVSVKRPRQAYSLYIASERKNVPADTPNKQVLQILAERWKSVTPEEKQKYAELASQDKKRYEAEVAANAHRIVPATTAAGNGAATAPATTATTNGEAGENKKKRKSPAPKLDAEGNPIPKAPRAPKAPKLDADGNVIPPKPRAKKAKTTDAAAPAATEANGAPTPAAAPVASALPTFVF